MAVAPGLSYITVERGSRTANVYKYGCGAVEEQQYAMLVQDKPRHTEPLPTKGGRKCGLVCYSRALELLEEEWGVGHSAQRKGWLRRRLHGHRQRPVVPMPK